LVIAKLDRLSRNLAFIAMLMDRKVDFVCCDNPTATKFTIHILAAVPEHERDAISARTKAALAAARARGSAPRPRGRCSPRRLSARAAADELNRRDVKIASAKPWHAMQIIRLRDRPGLCS
jgi:DNA invertase Pin-like site-specific DNA recombinase